VLDGELEGLALEYALIIDPEKVRVYSSLDDPSKEGKTVDGIPDKPAPNPVEEIKGAVETKAQKIVGRDALGFAGLLKHEELRENSDCLEEERKGPKILAYNAKVCPSLACVDEEKREDNTGGDKESNAEGIHAGVIRCAVLLCDKIENGSFRADEKDLHQGIVDMQEIPFKHDEKV
jgi:hypothetical protein